MSRIYIYNIFVFLLQCSPYSTSQFLHVNHLSSSPSLPCLSFIIILCYSCTFFTPSFCSCFIISLDFLSSSIFIKFPNHFNCLLLNFSSIDVFHDSFSILSLRNSIFSCFPYNSSITFHFYCFIFYFTFSYWSTPSTI